MNLLYIAHEGGNDFNGASRSLLSIVDYFSKRNNVFVIVPCNHGRLFEELKKRKCIIWVEDYNRWITFKSRNAIRWKNEKIKWLLKGKKHNNNICEKLAGKIVDNKIDIIHTNSSVVDIGARLHMITGIPHIWHFREFAQEDFNMWPLVSKKEFIRLVNEGCNKIVTVSKAVEQKYRSIVYENIITTIYNGIEITENLEKRNHEPNFNVLVSGLISEAKGQKIAVDAVISLIKSGYSNVHLYVAGKGNLDALAPAYLTHKENIHCLGTVEDMKELRSSMDVEVVCSRAEAFGRVTVEAMHSHLPVIGSNSGGTTELIKDGYNGYLFKPGEYLQLACRLKALIDDPELRKLMGSNAYNYMIKNFSIERCTSEIEKVYKEVTECNNR